MNMLDVGFVGVGGTRPGHGEEATCFVVNGSILIDVGFNAAVNMQALEVSPADIDHVLFTHCHHDHVLGLPGLLFAGNNRAVERPEAPPIQLHGPQDLTPVLSATLAMLQADRYPQVVPEYQVHHVYPGECIEVGDLRIDVGRAFHPLDARCYRFTDTVTRGSLVISGDTAYHEGLVDFARDCDVLIHEAAGDPEAESVDMRSLHSRPQDAARVAMEASASTLALVHYPPAKGAAVLTKAKQVFPNARLARKGQRVQVLGPGQAAWV
ncbi:MAG TPA: MBL fold metallo-hydrolase [Candidatus Handelsmanbacteria bacterium]|nr:MBL fold metallo-hydrolase [Candidatus Handelsmanbacteria bacterium]